MTDLWIARDGPSSDGRPGLVAIYQGKPQWCDDVDGWQGIGVRCLQETNFRFRIGHRQAMKLVMDYSSLVDATTAASGAASTGASS